MMNKYEKYKASNIEWIESVPKHWKLGAVKHCFKFKVGFTPPTSNSEFYDEDLGFDWVTISDIDRKFIYKTKNKISKKAIEACSKDIVPAGSLMYSFKLSVGKVAFAGKDVYTNEAIFSILPDEELELSYYYYSLPSILIHNANENIYGAKIFNQEVIKNSRLPIPPKIEQARIACFLDHQTAIIDEIIQRKEKQIELLKKKRQSIINEVVTKGLNPNAKMKDSSIEWLGKVPEDWKIVRLRFLGKCQNGVSQSGDYFGTGDPFVSYGDVYKNDALPDCVKGLAESSESDKENYSVIEGDVFFTRTSETIEEIGLSSVCLSTIHDAVFAGFLIRFRPYENILFKGYSRYFFRSLVPRVHFVKEMNLVTRASLSQELLKSLPVCLPNIDEQKVIASFLDGKVLKISELVQSNEKAIKKLKEYRQSLISETVTGKIDVRDWKAIN